MFRCAACAATTSDLTPGDSLETWSPDTSPSKRPPPPSPWDKEEPLSVTLEGPIGGSLAFALSPALGQDSVQQPWGPVRLGRLGGQGWKSGNLGPPRLDGVLILAVPPSSSSSPPHRLPTGGQRGNKHRAAVYSSWPKFQHELTRRAAQGTLCGGCVFMWGKIRSTLSEINVPPTHPLWDMQ